MGKSGHFGTSKDGEKWKVVSVGSSSDLQNIVYGNGRYVLVGDNGLILYSSDLEVWERQLSISISSNLLDVIYVKDMFYIVGSPNTLLTSLDGVTWSSSTLSNELEINRISYYKNKFKLTGDTKSIAMSNDGVDWTVSALPSKANYVAHNDEEMIWGGENSSIGKHVDKAGYIIKPEDAISDIHIHSANYSHGLFILGSVNKIYIVLENNLFKLSNNDADYYSIDIPNRTIIGALVIDNILVALDTEGYMLQIPLYYT